MAHYNTVLNQMTNFLAGHESDWRANYYFAPKRNSTLNSEEPKCGISSVTIIL